jgi:Ca-activated chloride channel family protein
MDPYNRLVTDLELGNFRVFENNVEQVIQYFSSENVPISIGVIFDLSGSMANKVGKAKEAAFQFFKTANPQDEFFLVGFNDRAEVVNTFTSSVEDLQSRILSAPAKGRTGSSMGSIGVSASCGQPRAGAPPLCPVQRDYA